MGETFSYSYAECLLPAWLDLTIYDLHGEGFRMPAITGRGPGVGRRTETAQVRTRGGRAGRYGDLRILL